MCGGHFWQLGSIASLATETTGGVILVAFWPKHALRSDLRVPNFKARNQHVGHVIAGMLRTCSSNSKNLVF